MKRRRRSHPPVRQTQEQTLWQVVAKMNAIAHVKGVRFGTGVYTGQAVRGVPNGKGLLVGDDGITRQGTWVNGTLHGLGTCKGGGQSGVFQGNWSHGHANGMGFLYMGEGRQQQGEEETFSRMFGIKMPHPQSACGIWTNGRLTQGTLVRRGGGEGILIETVGNGGESLQIRAQTEGMPTVKAIPHSIKGVIQALPTMRNGWHFRSRLEARWALLMDALGVPWVYEPYTFDIHYGSQALTAGTLNLPGVKARRCYYTPDFWLPGRGVWVEIKGAYPTVMEVTKARGLAQVTRAPVYIFYGSMGKPFVNRICSGVKAIGFLHTEGNGLEQLEPLAWVECPLCHALNITLRGQPSCSCGGESADYASGRYSLYFSRLERAYVAAQSFHF